MMPNCKASHTGVVRIALVLSVAMMVYTLAAAAHTKYEETGGGLLEGGGGGDIAALDIPDILGIHHFRATPAEDYDDNSVIALIAVLPGDGPHRVDSFVLYRSMQTYPTGPLDGVPLRPLIVDNAKGLLKYLDRDVRDGEEYFYTLKSYLDAGQSQQVMAKATAGTRAPDLLTEVFGYEPTLGEQDAYDLAHTQITIRPVGAPPPSLGMALPDTGYSAYEATVTQGVYSLPVARSDAHGGAYTLVFSDDNLIYGLTLDNRVFPYFGKNYNRIAVGANGYIGFEEFDILRFVDADIFNFMNFPSLPAHFAFPRISFFFTDLAPNAGGDTWVRILSDRVVVTFENVPLWTMIPLVNPPRVTVQVELFDGGHIRMTYLNTEMYSGIVGISDGRGVPQDPSLEFEEIKQAYQLSNFAAMPTTPRSLSIEPVATQMVAAGEVIRFDVEALVPPGAVGLPSFNAEWERADLAPFMDLQDGTGQFYWTTESGDEGIYTVRIKARLEDGPQAFQDVRLIVWHEFEPPIATNLQLSTASAYEDPRVSRAVPAGRPLVASYTYEHPYAHEMFYREGRSLLYWFRNGQVVPAFTNLPVVSANVPQPGDEWWFQITPVTLYGIRGAPVQSPVVTIMSVAEISAVSPSQGVTIGGERVVISGRYLSNPLSVKFGDIPGSDIRAVSDTEISVRTPIHPAGVVTVSVETPYGIGRKSNAFTFVGDADDTVPAEEESKERQIFGCGPRGTRASAFTYDLLLLVVTVTALMVTKRRGARGTV